MESQLMGNLNLSSAERNILYLFLMDATQSAQKVSDYPFVPSKL